MARKSSNSIFTQITKLFIDALKTGAPPWRKPWSQASPVPGFPVNAATERRYTGINITILWAAAIARGFEQDRWLTIRQVSNAGGRVRRGEKGTTAVLYRNIKIERETKPGEDDEEPTPQSDRSYKIARAFTLFNVEQCTGLPKKISTGQYPKCKQKQTWESHRSADGLVDLCGAKIRHTGSVATYLPTADIICMPPKSAFESTAGYYSTLMHELTHWTGHKSRLNRPGIVESHSFNSVNYAFEELVAEIGSAFLCADYRIFGELRHESYVLSWIKILENDPKAIFSSSAQAWKARNYLISQFAVPDWDKENTTGPVFN